MKVEMQLVPTRYYTTRALYAPNEKWAEIFEKIGLARRVVADQETPVKRRGRPRKNETDE